MPFSRLKYSVRVSFCQYWVWIVGPTLVWGIFPLFYAGLPESIRGDLTLPAYGMLMVTRAAIAAVIFAFAGFLMWRKLCVNGRLALKQFFWQEKYLLFFAVGAGLVLCRLFESLIFQSGEFAFALIFCVALTPFAERILVFLYVYTGRKRPHVRTGAGGLLQDLRTACVEWPTTATKIHSWLRLVLLTLVIILFLYAKQGFILRNPVDSRAIPAAMISDDPLVASLTIRQDPWTGVPLAEPDEPGVLLVVRSAPQGIETLFSGYGLLLLWALISALCLQLYYHLLDVLGARFGRVVDRLFGVDNSGEKDRANLTKVYIQQTILWMLAGLVWAAIWLAEPRNGLALLGDLAQSPIGMLAWVGGVALFGTVLCYFSDNFGIDRYSKWAERRELPVSASRWAGIATTVDPVISLLLVSAFGAALKEYVAVPWVAWGAALAMGLVFAARFQETASEVYQRTIDRAIRKRMQPPAAAEYPEKSFAVDVEAHQIAEFMALALDGSRYFTAEVELSGIRIIRKRVSGDRGSSTHVADAFLGKLCHRLAPGMRIWPMTAIIRLSSLGNMMREESERIDKLRLFLLERLRLISKPKGAFILEMDEALEVAGYSDISERERLRMAIDDDGNGWDLVMVTNPDWDTFREGMDKEWEGRVERTASVLMRILQGKARIAIFGDMLDLPISRLGHTTTISSLDELSGNQDQYDLALIADRTAGYDLLPQMGGVSFPSFLALKRTPTIAEREQFKIPWVELGEDVWLSRGGLARAMLGYFRETAPRCYRSRILIVEDNQRDFDVVSRILHQRLGPTAEILRYQPEREGITDYKSVFADILSRISQSPLDALIVDIDLSDEGFAGLEEKVTGIDLAADFAEIVSGPMLIALLSRARVSDLSRAEDAGVLIASKTDGGYARLAGEIVSRQPSLLMSGLAAYVIYYSGRYGALKRVLRTDSESSLESIIAGIEDLFQNALQDITSIRVLDLPEFDIKRRDDCA